MNLKEIAVSIVTAMMAVVIFAALIGPASASAGHLDIYKGTHPDPNAEYVLGDTITYRLIVTNPNLDCGCTVDIFDMFPNGTEILIADDVHLERSGVIGDVVAFDTTYVVDAGDIQADDRVWNRLRIDGIEDVCCGGLLNGSVWASSLIHTDVTFNFSYVVSGCMEATFTGSSTGPVNWYQWDFGDGTPTTKIFDEVPNADNAVTHLYTTRGDKTVRLYGESVTGKSDEKTLIVHVTGYPTAVAKADGHAGSIQLPAGGMNIIFDGTESSADSPAALDISKCHWTIDGTTFQGLGPHTVFIDHATSASLKVEDDRGCISYAHITILEPPMQDVPLMTPAGMLALIGVLCIVGSGRVLMKYRRL